MKAMRQALLVGLTLLSAMVSSFAFAQDATELERQVKAAYIFKFGNYVHWPDKTFADASSPMVIGIVDDEPLADELERISIGHTTGNRPAVIRRLNAKSAEERVHILYITQDINKYLSTYLTTFQQAPTLIITDAVDGLNAGSIINFVHENNRLRFDVSLRAMELYKIKLDASLLTVARQVAK
jgi:hypothetical protein